MAVQPHKQQEKNLEALKLYRQGFTFKQVGKALGIHQITAFRRVKRAEMIPDTRNNLEENDSKQDGKVY